MIIKKIGKSAGWIIEPQTFDEYQKIKPEIEALLIKFNTTMKVSTVDSIWVEMPELNRSQFEPGWPPAEPPSHEHGWPQAVELPPNVHDHLSGDSESYPFGQCNEQPNAPEN